MGLLPPPSIPWSRSLGLSKFKGRGLHEDVNTSSFLEATKAMFYHSAQLALFYYEDLFFTLDVKLDDQWFLFKLWSSMVQFLFNRQFPGIITGTPWTLKWNLLTDWFHTSSIFHLLFSSLGQSFHRNIALCQTWCLLKPTNEYSSAADISVVPSNSFCKCHYQTESHITLVCKLCAMTEGLVGSYML